MTPTRSPELTEQLLRYLGQFVSRINAQSLLSRALARSPGDGGRHVLDAKSIPAVIQRLQVSASLFVAPERRDEFREGLERFRSDGGAGTKPPPEAETIPIEAEGDIVVARTRARIMCEELGADRVAAHKVATVVSELARNIVSYTPGGRVELAPQTSPPGISVSAIDRGSGIPGLSEIMAGNYRSKTGLGLGLLGSKRLADAFQVDSGPSGTTVVARMRV